MPTYLLLLNYIEASLCFTVEIYLLHSPQHWTCGTYCPQTQYNCSHLPSRGQSLSSTLCFTVGISPLHSHQPWTCEADTPETHETPETPETPQNYNHLPSRGESLPSFHTIGTGKLSQYFTIKFVVLKVDQQSCSDKENWVNFFIRSFNIEDDVSKHK